MCGVVYDLQAVPVGDALDFLRIAGVPVNVHGYDRRGFFSNQRFDQIRIEIECLLFDIAEDGRQIVPVKRVDGRRKSERRRDHLSGEIQQPAGNLKRQRPVGVDGQRLGVKKTGQAAFELRGHSAEVAQLPAVPYLSYFLIEFIWIGQERLCDFYRFLKRLQ